MTLAKTPFNNYQFFNIPVFTVRNSLSLSLSLPPSLLPNQKMVHVFDRLWDNLFYFFIKTYVVSRTLLTRRFNEGMHCMFSCRYRRNYPLNIIKYFQSDGPTWQTDQIQDFFMLGLHFISTLNTHSQMIQYCHK